MTDKTAWYSHRIAAIILMLVLALLAFLILPHLAPCFGALWQKWRPVDRFTFLVKVYPWFLLGLTYRLYEDRDYPASPWQAYFFSLQIRAIIATLLIVATIGGGAIRLGLTMGDAYGLAAATAFLFGWQKYLPHPEKVLGNK